MKQRDIILIHFPFSDQVGMKIRPALVLSNDEVNKGEDIIICALTSQLKKGKYNLVIDQNQLEKGVLNKKSVIKVESLARIKKQLVKKTFARLDKRTFAEVKRVFCSIV